MGSKTTLQPFDFHFMDKTFIRYREFINILIIFTYILYHYNISNAYKYSTIFVHSLKSKWDLKQHCTLFSDIFKEEKSHTDLK